jgi:pyruvate dehydrogenase E1 component alpha subunit
MDTDFLLTMYRRMLRIRIFDERVKKMVSRGELPGAVHTSLGQEAEVVGACMALRDDDYMTGNHRSHGHPIGKGSALAPLMAEILGKATGVCKGKGGSMHLADFAVGSLGESGIVGSAIPVATGAGLSARVRGSGQVCLCFFGDGAANQGSLYESLNLAAVWRLPVVYLCENNQYASTTPSLEVSSVPRFSARAAGFGIPGVTVEDGQDVRGVHAVVVEAVERARAGDGPSLVEVMTYRYSEHSEGLRHAGLYRDEDEQAEWRARDPVQLFERALLADALAAEATLGGIRAEVEQEVADAVQFAQRSPWPEPESAFEDLYSEPIGTAPRVAWS